MNINTRGDNNTLVLARSGVPIFDISDALLARKDISWICNRFPVTVDEVFYALETVADLLNDFEGGINVSNVGDYDNIELETISINETVYFNILQYGRIDKPDMLDLDKLYSYGFTKVIKEIYQDLAEGKEYFKQHELHNVVYEALCKILPNVDPQLILNEMCNDR